MTDTPKVVALEEITVSRLKWREIQKELARLDALDAGGVDNWQWYGESLQQAGWFDAEDEDYDFYVKVEE